MTIRDTVKRLFFETFLVPFFLMIIIYFSMAWSCCVFIDYPRPRPDSVIKYCISSVCNQIDLSWYKFDFPAEFSSYFYEKYPQCGGEFDCDKYCHFINVLPKKEYAYPYTFFPYFLLTDLLFFAVNFAYNYRKMPKTKKFRDEKYLRGTNLISANDFCKKSKNKIRNPIAKVPTFAGEICLSENDFKEHQIVIGSTGTGKSQILMNEMQSLIETNSNIRMIVIDRKQEFYERFAGCGSGADVLLHPQDVKSEGWNIFNEINITLDENGTFTTIPDDVKAISGILFPKNPGGEQGVWVDGPRVLFSCALCWCIEHGQATTEGLARFLGQPLSKIIESFLNEKAEEFREVIGVLSEDKNSKTAMSILTITNSVIQQLKAFKKSGDFSVREWMRNGSGSLFISTAGGDDKVIENIVTLWIDLIAREIDELKNENEQALQFVFVLDELAAYPKLTKLNYLLSQARSKGVGVIVANQSFRMIEEIYGRGTFAQIVDCCKTRWILQLPETNEAEYAAKLIGKTEVVRMQKSTNKNSSILGTNTKTGTTRSEQIAEVYPLMPTEFFSLPKLNSVVVQPELQPDVSIVQLKFCNAPKVNAGFERAKENTMRATDFAATQPNIPNNIPNPIENSQTVSKKQEDDEFEL